MVERVIADILKRGFGETENLVEYVSDRAKLVVLHSHASLQLRNDHTYILVDGLKRLQLQLALYMRREGDNED